jgi:hypothetical protein
MKYLAVGLGTVLLLLTFSPAREIFLQKPPPGLGTMRLEKKYCMKNAHGREVCQEYTLEYPDCESCRERSTAVLVEGAVLHYLDLYRKSDPRKEVLERVEENLDFFGQVWSEQTVLGLFALTPSVVTLQVDTGGYSGGAHGYFATDFLDLDRRSGRRLKLSDLFLPESNATLIRIAERYYRLEHGIAPEASLREADDWFEDRFVLAEAFAVTSRGLHFVYNQYEIKPYAAGQSTFTLPYGAVASLIDPKGPLGFALGNPGTVRAVFADRESRLTLDAKLLSDGAVALEFRARNLGADRRGWLSVSFPGIEEASRVRITESRGLKAERYGAGRRIFHRREKKNLPANYLLVEGEDRKWSNDKTDRLFLKIFPPGNATDLIVDFRLFFREPDGKTFYAPQEDEGKLRDQQGFPAYRIVLPLK